MTDGPLAEVFRAARAVGWQVSVLDLTGVSDKAAFMERCVRALDLPEWFGRNWTPSRTAWATPTWGPPARAVSSW